MAVVGTIASMLAAPPAFAGDRSDNPDAIAALVSDAAAIAGAPEREVAADEVISVTVPSRATQPIVLDSTNGPGLTVSLPDGVALGKGTEAGDGSTIYLGEAGQPDVSVEPLVDGVRVSTILHADTQARSFDYTLPEGVDAELTASGRIELTKTVDVEAEGTEATVTAVVGYIEPAWAVDAAGRSVSTSYEVSDSRITQHVATDATTTFPIVADPQWSKVAWNQIRIRWNRAETATIAGGGWGATGVTGLCAAAGTGLGGPAAGAALGALCLGLSGAAVYTAGVAQNSNPKQCLEMYATFTFIVGPAGWVPWFGTYSGGSCR